MPIAESVAIDVTTVAVAAPPSGIADRSTNQRVLPRRRRALRIRPVAMASTFSHSRTVIVLRPVDVVSIVVRAVRAVIITETAMKEADSSLNAGLTSARILSPLAIPRTPVSQRW